jgi:acetyl esterase/lipase
MARVAFGAGFALLLACRGLVAGPVEDRVAMLAAEVTAAEDVSSIKRLQRSYGYYLDKGLWTDLSEYFTEDAVANYPAGVFVGKQSIREHLYRNVGNVPVGQVGLGENRLYNHLNLQPVVHLDPGGQTAKGRWRALAMFGSIGGGATWAEGIYEMQYRKEGDTWKIAKLDYYGGFSAPYATGWTAPPPAASREGTATPATPEAPRARRALAHAPDRERDRQCEGFPQACIPPFHYANPGTPAGGQLWTDLPTARVAGPLARVVGDLARRAERLRDEQQVENLQRIYGYYLDRGHWDQAADLFAEGATLEYGGQGVYVGRERIRAYLGADSPQGLVPGVMHDHIQLQPIATIAADGRTAWLRSRQLVMAGRLGGTATLEEGVFENRFVKEDGRWKFSALRYYPTFITDYDQGWGKAVKPLPGPRADLPPDRPPSSTYAIYPKPHVPPFHYRNPVTGKPATYPADGGPDTATAKAVLAPRAGSAAAARVLDTDAVLGKAQQDVARARDYHEIENLESAYGYYLDKNLWNPLADLFARDGSIELAQRGVFKGPRVRGFLLQVFGRGEEGPVAGRLGNHVQLQSVITVAEDGRTGRIRQRMLQQMSLGGRASWGGAIYENEVVREDGVWKFSKVHAWNTFSANYDGGWTKGVSRGMPGPSPEFLPDSPPTARIAMFPVVYDIPYHYANPVTGRTVAATLPTIDEQMKQYPLPPSAPPRAAAPAGMPADVAAQLRAIGPKIDPGTAALYAPLHPKEPWPGVSVKRDVAYGPHERHRLDVFAPAGPGRDRPVVVFIHGGGFSRGAKSAPGSPFYDNIGRWAASNGLVGVTINYRLAPQFPYPAGVEDLTRVVAWVRSHAKDFGGDATRVFLWGHSAGGAHAADYIVRAKRPGVAGAILTSGIYALGDTVSVWKDYYGEDVAAYRAKESAPLLARSALPLLVVHAELDPPAFVADTEGLLKARAAAGRPTRSVKLPNHSHLSETYAIGTEDTSLAAPVLDFIREPAPPADR